MPPYASPAPTLSPAIAVPAQTSAPTGIVFEDVEVSDGQTGSGDAAPRRDWLPPSDPETGFVLHHRPGEPLGASWVRDQFEQNGLLHAHATADKFLALVQLINRAYLSAGFINSGLLVPPQHGSGVLQLKLVMGRLAEASGKRALHIKFKNGHGGGLSSDYLRHRLPAAEAQPLNAVELEREFRLLAADPAIRTINANLQPGSGPGEATLDLTVDPQNRYDVYGSFANDRSPAVGGERLAIGGFIRNLLAPADVLSAELGTTDGLKDGFASFVTPFLSPRTTLSVHGSFDNAAVIVSALVPLDIRSRDRVADIGIAQKLIDEPLTPAAASGNWIAARTLSAGISIAHRRSKSFLFGEPFSFSPGFVNGHSHYTAIRLNGDYISRSATRVMAASLTATGGLGGTRSDIPGVPTPKRNFIILLAQLNGAQRLSHAGLELRARLTAQYANSILYAGERLAVGGEQTVRGYRENLLLADRGIIASLELTQPFMLTRPRPDSKWAWGSFAMSAFTEGAYVGNVDVPNPDKRGIYSIGVGLRWTPSDALDARISYAEGLVHVHPSDSRDLQDRGINFRITVRPLLLFRH